MKIEALKKRQVEIGKSIVEINRGMLAEKVRGLNGADIYTLYTRTDARLRKTSKVDKKIRNPYGKVFKVATVNGMVNVSYESCVNKQRGREGTVQDFQAKARSFGQQAGGGLLTHQIDGEERKYIQFNPRNCLSVVYEDINGNEIDKALLADFISDKKPSRQGVEKEIVWRAYKVDSIVALAANKVFWVIVD